MAQSNGPRPLRSVQGNFGLIWVNLLQCTSPGLFVGDEVVPDQLIGKSSLAM